MLHSGLKFLWWQKKWNPSRLWCKQTSSFPKFHFFCCILDYCAASEWFYICTIKLRQLTWVDGFQKWTWIEWARSNWYQNRGITFLFWCSLEHLDLRLWIFCLLWFLKKIDIYYTEILAGKVDFLQFITLLIMENWKKKFMSHLFDQA